MKVKAVFFNSHGDKLASIDVTETLYDLYHLTPKELSEFDVDDDYFELVTESLCEPFYEELSRELFYDGEFIDEYYLEFEE